LITLLVAARRRGLRVAACSDYPPAEKLAAMGIAGLFDVVVSAQDPDVQRFKPDPRMLEVALERLGVSKEEALYVGDRPEVDAEAARRAGIACAIVGSRRPAARAREFLSFASLGGLVELLN
jgi:putative hydrolase of the HAD superfamily